MDSGSSGSMQSSSGGGGGGGGGGVGGGGGGGGDEEYDSRGGESISSFLNQHQSSHFGSISNQQPPPLQLSHHQQSNHHLHHHHHQQQQQQQQPTFFDLHSQNLEAFPQSLSTTQNANLQYNNEMIWSRPLRSEPNYANFANFSSSSSSSLSLSSSSSLPSSTQSLFGINQPPPLQPSSVEPTRASSSSHLDHHHNHHHQPNLAVKNPKKRTRASRRAPTTVLTTDTANFRQMVQEFTGIPAAPFAAAASPYSRRLDLFSTAGGGGGSALGSLYHPLRPSAQKVPFIGSSSSTNNTITAASIAGTSSDLQKQPQNLFNMHNQLLNFQPSLQQQTNLAPSMGNDQPFFTTRSQGTTTTTTTIDELGMSHHHHQQQQQINANNLSGFSNPGRSEAMNDDNIQRFGGRHEAFDHGNNDGNGVQHVSSFIKLNSSSSSDFYPEKVLENGSSGGTEFRNYNN